MEFITCSYVLYVVILVIFQVPPKIFVPPILRPSAFQRTFYLHYVKLIICAGIFFFRFFIPNLAFQNSEGSILILITTKTEQT